MSGTKQELQSFREVTGMFITWKHKPTTQLEIAAYISKERQRFKDVSAAERSIPQSQKHAADCSCFNAQGPESRETQTGL